jgi:hypothetical protein
MHDRNQIERRVSAEHGHDAIVVAVRHAFALVSGPDDDRPTDVVC